VSAGLFCSLVFVTECSQQALSDHEWLVVLATSTAHMHAVFLRYACRLFMRNIAWQLLGAFMQSVPAASESE
jgi:hypothetical protein